MRILYGIFVVFVAAAAILLYGNSCRKSSAVSDAYVLPRAGDEFLVDAEELTQSGNFVRVKLSFGLPKVEERIFKLSTLPLVFNQDAFGKLRLKLKNGSTLWFDDNGNCWLGVDVGDTVRYDGKSIVRALRFKSDVFWRDEPYLELL